MVCIERVHLFPDLSVIRSARITSSKFPSRHSYAMNQMSVSPLVIHRYGMIETDISQEQAMLNAT